MGKDEVPSVRYVLGADREITGVSNSVEDGISIKVVQYRASENPSEDMRRYVQALTDSYGFYNFNGEDFSGDQGIDFEYAKVSVESGYVIVVRIDYDSNGYTITYKRGLGSLTFIGVDA